MAHEISGIITSFRYAGERPACHLVGDSAFIPLDSTMEGFKGDAITPFVELTTAIEQLAKDLSSNGACAYIETHYHGGMGCQMAIVWQDEETVLGPLTEPEPPPRLPWWRTLFTRTADAGEVTDEEKTSAVRQPINEALRALGIRCSGEDDEFDTAGLGRARSNERFLNDFCGDPADQA